MSNHFCRSFQTIPFGCVLSLDAKVANVVEATKVHKYAKEIKRDGVVANCFRHSQQLCAAFFGCHAEQATNSSLNMKGILRRELHAGMTSSTTMEK